MGIMELYTLDKFEGKRNQEITKSALQHWVTSTYMQVVWTGKKQKLKLEFLILAIHAIVSFLILKCCCRAMSASWYWIVKGCNKEKLVVVKPPTKMYIPYEKKAILRLVLCFSCKRVVKTACLCIIMITIMLLYNQWHLDINTQQW